MITDIAWRVRPVERCVALAPSLFDHLVGGGEQRLWNGESERFGGLEIENQLEFGRLYDRKIGGFSPLRMRPV